MEANRPGSQIDHSDEEARMSTDLEFEPANVNVRVKISTLWTAMLFVFAYVDIFSLYRRDVRTEIEAGEIGGFTIDQAFLLGTTIYVAIPSLMVFGALVLGPRINRIANIALGVAYALTIVVGAIGEWNYYVLGSAIEVAALAGVVYYAWTWPKRDRRHEIEAAGYVGRDSG
jgi:Family of unknown function (DUF6326)